MKIKKHLFVEVRCEEIRNSHKKSKQGALIYKL